MAVVQISRIQVRRGREKSDTGIPQLASGEIAWALDTQQLYIGNGSVAEGAPAVGNTKILTENDLNGQGGNILDLVKYIYKYDLEGSLVQTGTSAASPIVRLVQDRLDDRVTSKDFGTQQDAVTDDTRSLQRAINQLFLNSAVKSSLYDVSNPLGTADAVQTRVVLELPAGRFKITGPLYIPSYATIVGAGQDKTIIEHTGAGPALQFVNDNSTTGATPGEDTVVPGNLSSSTYTTQPRYISVSNLTVYTKTNNLTALQLDAVRDSKFENLSIRGDWDITVTPFSAGSKAIVLNAFSDQVTCERNIFKNVRITGFQTAIFAPQDISRNTFDELYINNVYDGFIFGARFFGETSQLQEVSGNAVGEYYGPRFNVITNSVFGDVTDGIKRYAMFLGKGYDNTIADSRFINVGHDGQRAENAAICPQVYFTATGNTLKNISSDRSKVASIPSTVHPYVPEVSGTATYDSFGTAYATLSGASATPFAAFRLPLATNQLGNPQGKNSFVIDYVFKSYSADNFVRQGKLYVSVDADNGVAQLTDEYNFAGVDNTSEIILDFKAVLLDTNNVDYTNPLTQTLGSLAIKYSNLPDSGIMYYSYSSTVYDSGIIPTV